MNEMKKLTVALGVIGGSLLVEAAIRAYHEATCPINNYHKMIDEAGNNTRKLERLKKKLNKRYAKILRETAEEEAKFRAIWPTLTSAEQVEIVKMYGNILGEH